MKQSIRFVGVILTMALIWVGWGAGPAEAQPKRISIGTADTGGVYYI